MTDSRQITSETFREPLGRAADVGAPGNGRRLHLTSMSEVRAERMRWLVPDVLPLRTVTVIAGRGGEGKSTWTLGVAAKATRGELEGDLRGPVPVLIIGHEDDKATVLKPRLDAAGADSGLVKTVEVETIVDKVTSETVPVFPLDLAVIREAVAQTGARLLIIDPLTSTMEGNPDRVADVRHALNPLAALAAELDIAVLAVMHVRKGAGNVSDLLSGSHAFRDVARSVLLVVTDPETDNRIVTIDKSNYSQSRDMSFAFRLESVEVPTEDGTTTTVARAVELGASEVSVDDVVNREDTLSSLSDTMTALAAVVDRHPEGISPTDAAAEAGIAEEHRGLAYKYLPRLVRQGLIEKVGRGRYRPLGTAAVRVGGSVPSVTNLWIEVVRTHETHIHSPARAVPNLLCSVCGEALHPSQVEFGTHPNCDPTLAGWAEVAR